MSFSSVLQFECAPPSVSLYFSAVLAHIKVLLLNPSGAVFETRRRWKSSTGELKKFYREIAIILNS